jgi:hypothetical protein
LRRLNLAPDGQPALECQQIAKQLDFLCQGQRLSRDQPHHIVQRRAIIG